MRLSSLIDCGTLKSSLIIWLLVEHLWSHTSYRLLLLLLMLSVLYNILLFFLYYFVWRFYNCRNLNIEECLLSVAVLPTMSTTIIVIFHKANLAKILMILETQIIKL